jgi:tetratricopeptide (TPR) repeat protein
MPDIFISYARADNATGAISSLIADIAQTFLPIAGRPLDPFFDLHAIAGMDDWRDRILSGLQQCSVLVTCLTPAYLASPYCEWEFNEFLKGEIGHVLAGAGVAPIYLASIPGWDSPDYDRTAPPWIKALRGRNWFDLRTSFAVGPTNSSSTSVDLNIRALADRIAARVLQIERAAGPGNVDSHNIRFTGRAPQMQALRHRLAAPEAAPGFTALHGLPGIGKTAMAVEYAHSYAHQYPGGRWQTDCTTAPDLDTALARLAPALRLDFRPDEPADPAHRAQRVLAELRAQALPWADSHLIPDAVPRTCLLLLDNVVRPEMLSTSQTKRLPSGRAPSESWLHCLLTTPLGPHDLPDLPGDCFVEVDELTGDEALSLLARFQPAGGFRNDDERTAAREIVYRLGGYTLAVEAAAVYLGDRTGTSCTEYLRILEAGGVAAQDVTSARARGGLRHLGRGGSEEPRVIVTLEPLLGLLMPDERLAVQYAALMPPGYVVWEWLESLTGDKYPAIQVAASEGGIDRWTLIRDRLQSLRLLTTGGVPWAARMHRLVQEVVCLRADVAKLSRHVKEHALKRCGALERDFDREEDAWEVAALRQWSLHLMDADPLSGGVVESRVADLLMKLGRFSEELPLRRHVLAIREELLGREKASTIHAANDFGVVLHRFGVHDEAEDIFRHWLSVSERVLGADHQNTLASVNNLALLLEHKGGVAEAEPLFRRALEARERVLGAEHPDTLTSVNNLAFLLERKGEPAEAEPMYRRALEARERALGAEHPDTLASVNNLAVLLEGKGEYAEAEPMYRRALEGLEKSLGPNHPNTKTARESHARSLAALNSP